MPATCRIYCSRDGGRTWPEYALLGEWCCEVNVAQLPTGRLLASIRYQRPSLADDPPDLLERTGALATGHTFPYKHVFVAHSDDAGLTWTPPRQLATVLGQCYGYGVGLSHNRTVVVTDHRYPREMSGGRAVVSHDDGGTWRDVAGRSVLSKPRQRSRLRGNDLSGWRRNAHADRLVLRRCELMGQLHRQYRLCAHPLATGLDRSEATEPSHRKVPGQN